MRRWFERPVRETNPIPIGIRARGDARGCCKQSLQPDEKRQDLDQEKAGVDHCEEANVTPHGAKD